MPTRAVRRILPGVVLLHPVAFVALAILVLNDQWWKAAWPGTLTGKASDAAGLVLAPLVFVAAIELLRSRGAAPFVPSGPLIVGGALAVGAGFIANKSL